MQVDNTLYTYIEKNIFPLYKNNFIGDGKDRIDYVINRSQDIIRENNLNINNNILFTAISFHDIRQNNNETGHELISANIMYEDNFIKTFFTEDERLIIKEAIEDQRASLESNPRNIYGKILSSESRNSSIEQCFKRSYEYGKKKTPTASDEELFESSYNALLKKFGKDGYAKFYFKDSTYEQFLLDIRNLLSDKSKFISAQKNYISKLKISSTK